MCAWGCGELPLVPDSIQFREKMHRMKVAVNCHLRYPLILGTGWAAFTQLLGILCVDASWETGRGNREAVAQTEMWFRDLHRLAQRKRE